MGIFAGLLAAIGVVGMLLWRLNQAAAATRGIAEAASDAHGFVRRLMWRRKSNKNPLDMITNPREAAAAMLAAVAQWDGAMTQDEMTAIKSQMMEHFGATQKQAAELLAGGRWLARDVTDLGAFLKRASPAVVRVCSAPEKRDLIAMLDHIASLDGPADELIRAGIAKLAEHLAH